MRIIITSIICLLLLCGAVGYQAPAQASLTNNDELFSQHLKKVVQETKSFNDPFEAQVWFTDMARRLKKRIPNVIDRLNLLSLVHTEAHQANLPPELILAVIDVESNFDRWAISHVGARGLMQIMPFWKKEIGKMGDNLFHVQTNLRFGCSILRRYLDRERGNIVRALGRYNGSLGSYRYPSLVMSAMRKRWYRP